MSMGTYFPGRGTLIEETYLRGVAHGYEEEREKRQGAGRAAVRRGVILLLLKKRRIAVPVNVRERITDCADLELLERWRERAFTAPEAEALFSDE